MDEQTKEMNELDQKSEVAASKMASFFVLGIGLALASTAALFLTKLDLFTP